MIDHFFSYVTQKFSPFVKGKDLIFGFHTNKGCLQVHTDSVDEISSGNRF